MFIVSIGYINTEENVGTEIEMAKVVHRQRRK